MTYDQCRVTISGNSDSFFTHNFTVSGGWPLILKGITISFYLTPFCWKHRNLKFSWTWHAYHISACRILLHFFLYKHHILGILPYWPHEGPVIVISFLKEFIFPFIWNWSAFYDHFIFGWRICPLFSPPYTLNSHWRWYRHWFPCIFASCSMKRWNTPRKHVIYILNYIIISNLYVQTAS